MRYERRSETVQAQQWLGDLAEFEVATLRKVEGMTGYAARLAYIDMPDGNVVTVRPSDFVLKNAEGKISVMSSPEFEKTYKEVANSRKPANNNAKGEDNFM